MLQFDDFILQLSKLLNTKDDKGARIKYFQYRVMSKNVVYCIQFQQQLSTHVSAYVPQLNKAFIHLSSSCFEQMCSTKYTV